MQTHHDKLGVASIDDRDVSEMIQCPKCRNWSECFELGDYFCRKCRPLKQEMSRVDTFFQQLADEVFKEINK